jgi:hypothetical protein
VKNVSILLSFAACLPGFALGMENNNNNNAVVKVRSGSFSNVPEKKSIAPNQRHSVALTKEKKSPPRDLNKPVEFSELVRAIEERDDEKFAMLFNFYQIHHKDCNVTANELLLKVLKEKNWAEADFKPFLTEVLKRIEVVDRGMKLNGQGAYTLAKKQGPKVVNAMKAIEKQKKEKHKQSQELQQELKERLSIDSSASRNSSIGVTAQPVEKKKASKKSEQKSEENKSPGFLALLQGLIPHQKKDNNKPEAPSVNTIEYKTLELNPEQLENLRSKHDSLPQELANQEEARKSKILQDSKLD